MTRETTSIKSISYAVDVNMSKVSEKLSIVCELGNQSWFTVWFINSSQTQLPNATTDRLHYVIDWLFNFEYSGRGKDAICNEIAVVSERVYTGWVSPNVFGR